MTPPRSSISSPLIAGAAALIGSGIISGQASRATMNVLNGQAWNSGLFQVSDMLIDTALSVIPFKLLGGSFTQFGAQGLKFGNQTVSAAKQAFSNLQSWTTRNFDLGAVTSGGLPVPKKWFWQANDKSAQLPKRGWTPESIQSVLDNPAEVLPAPRGNMATGNPATIYYRPDGHYIILDDVTNDIVQGSDLHNSGWLDEYYLPERIEIHPRPKQ